MAIKQIMAAASVMGLACLMACVSAFVTPSASVAAGFRGQASVTARTTSGEASGVLMSCRVNAKKEKRQRNRDNMRKFNKRGVSRKKVLRVERQERAAEAEAEFMALVFHTGMDDWEDVDIFND